MPEKFLTLANRISLSFFLIVVLDVFFLNHTIFLMLPSNITQFTWYYFIFGLPHIIASFVSYFSKEYATYYRKNIIRGLMVTLLSLIFITLFLPHFFMLFFIAYTMYHVGWQQIGMCRKYIKNINYYRIWSTSAIITIVTLALSVGGESLISVPNDLYVFLQTTGKLSLFVFILSSVPLWKYGEYVFTTFLIFALGAISILSGYFIIGILMIRFIHDISAFAIYIQHDSAYRKKTNLNYLYRVCAVQPQYIIFFLPIFSIIVSFLLQQPTNIIFTILIVEFSLMHYYLEAIVWKKGTLHRNTLG